jgi:hypothetical protein
LIGTAEATPDTNRKFFGILQNSFKGLLNVLGFSSWFS